MDEYFETEVPTTSRKRKPKRPCDVCGETSHGAHFGAEACRACAAFFRRSVAHQRKYHCKTGGTCELAPNVRCMCRACRFEKCLQAGMRKIAVQRFQGALGHEEDSIEECPSPPENPGLSKEMGMPTLLMLSKQYKAMEKIRKILHDRRSHNAVNKPNARAVNFIEADEVNLKELGLVADLLKNSFTDLHEMDSSQKKILYRNFLRKFIVLEGGYFGSQKKNMCCMILPTGDFIDLDNPESFFPNPNETNLMSKEEAMKMFLPMFDNYRRCVIQTMKELRVDEIEFLFLCSLMFWETGLEAQTEESEAIVVKVRNRIIDEAIFYFRQMKRLREPATRMSSLMTILPPLQRVIHKLQQDIEFSHAFDLYKVDQRFFDIVNGSF